MSPVHSGYGQGVAVIQIRSFVFRKFAFKQLEKAGAVLTTSECAILALLGGSDHPNFKGEKLIMTSTRKH